MNVLFEFPFGLAALAAVPLLLAIYLLRNRFRHQSVSSLMLWGLKQQHKQGGLNLDRLQTPLLFILELLVFLLLAMAAAAPLLRSKSDTRRIVVVLDDSFSMLAQSDDVTTRQIAVGELKRYLKSSAPFRVSFVLAGLDATVLSRDIDNVPEAASVLEQWQCLSPAADLDTAMTLAGEIGMQQARLLVVTDHFPKTIEADSRLEYWSLGRPLSNVGFVHAERTRADNRDRCMLSVGNFGTTPQSVTLTIASLDGKTRLHHQQIEIAPDDPFRMVFEAPRHLDVVASIADDALDIDNRVTLLRLDEKPVRVTVDLEHEALADSITKILDVLPQTRQVSQAGHIRITDKEPVAGIDTPLLTLHIQSDPNAAAFVGPFVIDRSHPLTEGLDLQGVIWAAGKNQNYYAVPIISAGNTALLEAETDNNNAEHLRLYLNPDISTLTQSPNWPIFFWNLLEWQRGSLGGLQRTNWRLGSQVVFKVQQDSSGLQLMRPDGQKQNYDRPTGIVVFNTDRPGIYQITTDDNQYAFAVNAVSADESDLRDCRTERRINPDQAVQFWWEYRSYNWLLLLAALIVLALHAHLICRQSKGRVA